MTSHVLLKRRGFTLIELLVVIVIISILAALSLRVIGGMMQGARRAATSATLSKIDGRIKNRVQTLAEIDMIQYEIAAQNEGAAPDKPAEKQVLARKILFKEAFPQSWNEFEEKWPLVWDEIYVEAQAGLGNSVSSGPHPPGLPSTPDAIAAESAEVLYYTLTRAPIPGQGKRKVISGVAQTTADEFGEADVKDTDGDGLLEFVDAWGNPLRFYRWPTRLLRPTGDPENTITVADLANARVLIPSLPNLNESATDPDCYIERLMQEKPLTDPDDPYGVMVSKDPNDLPCGLMLTVSGFTEAFYHTASTYHVPLVVSAGEDGKLGLKESVDNITTDFGHLCEIVNIEEVYDNISNRNNNNAGGN